MNFIQAIFLFSIMCSISNADNYGLSYSKYSSEYTYNFSDNYLPESIVEDFFEIGIFNPKIDFSLGFGNSESFFSKKETRSLNISYKIVPIEQFKFFHIGVGGFFDISSITLKNGNSYSINDWFIRTQLGISKSFDNSTFGFNLIPLYKLISPKQNRDYIATSKENFKILINIFIAHTF